MELLEREGDLLTAELSESLLFDLPDPLRTPAYSMFLIPRRDLLKRHWLFAIETEVLREHFSLLLAEL